jgi:ribosome-binding factor A
MAKTRAQGRVAERIRMILSELIQFQMNDPRLSGVTVLDVEIDRELMYATIYVSSLGGEEVRQDVMQGLASASGLLRREVGSRVNLRRVPELRFVWDETAARAARIEELLSGLEIPSDGDAEGSDDTGSERPE